MQVGRYAILMPSGLALLGLLALAACSPAAATPTLYPTPATATVSTALAPSPTPSAGVPPHSPAQTGDLPSRTLSPSSSPTLPPSATGQPNASGIPPLSHVFIVVMENKDYGSVVGSSAAPYINSLIDEYGLATNYTAVAHPSEPNYLALFSGSTWGIVDDAVHDVSGRNIADQIEAVGKTWRVFEGNWPGGCYTGYSADNLLYARKHNPAISFTNINGSPTRCANITDLSHFDPAAANYELIVPNQCNDMHNCGVDSGDAFLKGFVPTILSSRAWKDGGVLFILWDEGTTNVGGGGHVPLLVISSLVSKGTRSSVAHNHYSLLKTIEDAWGMACLNQACNANNLAEFFH